MDKLLLAIDGGGSKTHAMLTDLNGKVVEESIVAEGSNPWKSDGYTKAAHAVTHCLEKLKRLDNVVVAVAGISGCHSDNKFSKDFHQLIAARLPQHAKVAVEGDLITSFRASSPTPHGQLAIAGSGSAIAHFYPDGTNYAYDGIGYGGRDIGAAIIASVQRGEQPPAVISWLTDVFGGDPQPLPRLGEIYFQKQVLYIAKELTHLAPENSIYITLRPLILHCAWRWAYKLWGTSRKYRTRANLAAHEPITTVLSGGAWNLAMLRHEVMRLLSENDANNTLIFEPESTAIHGAVQLAQDLSATAKVD